MWNLKASRRKHIKIDSWSWIGKYIYIYILDREKSSKKLLIITEKINNELHKNIELLMFRNIIKKIIKQLQNEREYSQFIYMTNDFVQNISISD